MADLPTGTVTFLFTDIEGSTRLLGELGAVAFSDALTEHRRQLRAAFTRHGGVEVDTQGDAFFVAFADATAAIRAAQESQEALAGGRVRVRMGLHTGTPHLAVEGYVGEDVHLGARIAAAGHGGQVLLSRATTQAVGEAVETNDLGEHRLKDFAEPVWIYQLGAERFPPLKTISNTNLPRPASSFVGRGREVAEVTSLLRDSARLVTLTGPGGTGKTRLAIESATELVPDNRNGVFWVPLAAVTDPAVVNAEIGQTLGAKDGVADHIGDREMLLVIDNFEQLLDAAPDVAALLRACPRLKLLVTSRALLDVQGEVQYQVPPLAETEAVSLFTVRSGAEATRDVVELCRRLDNLPLAVELAAARTRALSVAQILERLGNRLDSFRGARDVDPRQRTLRATIEWSHDLLDTDQRDLFARLAVFAGGCTLEAAETVAGAELDTLEALVAHSLVRHSRERFWMLETIREFATERLESGPHGAALRDRHAGYFLDYAEAVEPHLIAPDRDAWLAAMEPEHDNMRAALDHLEAHGEIELALRLSGAIAEFWDQRGHHVEGARRYATLLASGAGGHSARAKALNGASMLATKSGQTANAYRWGLEAIELHRGLGDKYGLANGLWGVAYLYLEDGELDNAHRLLSEAVALFREIGDEDSLIWVTRTLAFLTRRRGDAEGARLLYEDALERARRRGERPFQAILLGTLADIAVRDDRRDDAIQLLRQSMEMLTTVVDAIMSLSVLSQAANVLQALGNDESAVQLVGFADAAYNETGSTEIWVARMNESTKASAQERLGVSRVEELTAAGSRLTADGARDIAAEALAKL